MTLLVRVVRISAWLGFAALMVYRLLATPASAFSLFDDIDRSMEATSGVWARALAVAMHSTFVTLGIIEIAWAAVLWAFEKDTLNGLTLEIIKKIMLTGFLSALMENAPEWIPAIVQSFVAVGESAGSTGPISTDGILNQGLGLISILWVTLLPMVMLELDSDPEEVEVLGSGTANPIAYGALVLAGAAFFCTIVTSVIVGIAYVVVAAQYFMLRVESWVLFAAGIFFLALGCTPWTRDYVTKYLNFVVNCGVRYIVLILVLSLTLSRVHAAASAFIPIFTPFTFNFYGLFEMLVGAVLQALLALKAPEMAGSLMGGMPALTAGSPMQSALSMFNYAMMFRGVPPVGGANGHMAGRPGDVGGGGASGPAGLRNAVNPTGNHGPRGGADRSDQSAAVQGLGGSSGAPHGARSRVLRDATSVPPPGRGRPSRS